MKPEEVEAKQHLVVLYTIKDSEAALGYLFNIVEIALSEFNLLYVDALLEHLNPNNVNTVVSTGLIRVTSRARTRLPSWITCFCNVKQTCICRGEDPDHLLRGLIKSPNDD